MPLYSTTLTLVWQLAAVETVQAGWQFIEREQLLIGLLKVGDILDQEVRDAGEIFFPQKNLELLNQELAPLVEILARFHLDRNKLLRTVRHILGRGQYVHEEKVVHRSPACKAYFKRAEEIARSRQDMPVKPIHLGEAILENPGEVIEQALRQQEVNPEDLRKALAQAGAPEGVIPGGRMEGELHKQKPATPLLDRYGMDLTRLAREGKIEPLIGRRGELLQVIRTLTRKTKNNPILVGEAGVGKTAIVRGLALRIAQGNIAPDLRDKRIIELNLAKLVAGTKYRGEFEERLVNLLAEVRKNEEVVLFIDELHTVVGAGRAEGSMDAANIMKPALSSGELRCIGATTLEEYRKYIEKDAALERRFQPVMVEEPTPAEALEILRGLQRHYEEFHQVTIDPGALQAAVDLAIRYLPERRLPDKALDIVDEACSRIKVNALSFYGKRDEASPGTGTVTAEVVAKVVADWSGRPVERLGEEEAERFSRMAEELRRRVIGQEEAVAKVAELVKMARAGLRDPRKPTGVFLFLGPTGVGKTELAKALAEFLFGSEDQMIRLDMSEFMEKHSVAKLIGSPPGYVGYEEEGQLTGRLRRTPYTVVLLDEIEKAHPEVLDIFLQLFDEGRLTDAKGRTIDGKNAIFIMTSNIGGEELQRPSLGFGAQKPETPASKAAGQLQRYLRPEFLNRIDEIVVFKPLQLAEVIKIASLMVQKLTDRLGAQGIGFKISESAMSFLAEQGFDPRYGARPLARTIDRLLGQPLADLIIQRQVTPGDLLQATLEDRQIVLKIEGGQK